MKSFFTSTALASLLVAGALFTLTPAGAQNNEPCVGENCPAPDMQGDQGSSKKRLKDVDQNNQNTEEPSDQPMNGKKRIQGSTDENEMQDGQSAPRKKRAERAQQDKDVDVNVDVDVGSQKRARSSGWKFDSDRHQRRRSKSATFRFYLDGYWYAQPYWEVYGVRSGRVSCGEGRAIVSARFARVRVVECNGGTYTYLGRREGDTFRILLNARTGRIVGRALI